jgi:surface protein
MRRDLITIFISLAFLKCEDKVDNVPDFSPEKLVYEKMQTNKFFLDDNGITIKCHDANFGDISLINGKEYTVIDESTLRAMVDNNEDLTCVCTSKVKNMSSLFENKTSFNQKIGGWDVANVETMRLMFSNATSFNQDISKWNTHKVEDFSGLFLDAISFNKYIGDWDTSSVIQMQQTFKRAFSFNTDISKWDTSSVKTMRGMFSCTPYKSESSSGEQEILVGDELVPSTSLVSNFNQNISNWDTSNVTDMALMFDHTQKFNKRIGSWDTSRVTNMIGMFQGAISFNQEISTWNTSNVTDMSFMFNDSKSFNNSLGKWDTSKVIKMEYMFFDASSFGQNLSNWCVSNINEEPYAFSSGSQLTFSNKPVWGTCPSN